MCIHTYIPAPLPLYSQDGPEGLLVNPECVVERVNSSQFELLLKVESPGHYVGNVLYKVWWE